MPFTAPPQQSQHHASLTGSWDLDATQERVRYVPGWKTLLGYPEDGERDATRVWRMRVHPDDLAPMLGAQRAHLDGWTACYDQSFRLRDAAGHYRRVHSRGWVVARDGDGQAVRMAGSIADLSEGVTRADPPHAIPADVPAAVMNTELVGLLRTEAGTVTWANLTAQRWLGAQPGAALEDLAGAEPQRLQLREAVKLLRAVGGRQRLQLLLKGDTGRGRWHELSGMPVASGAARAEAMPDGALWALVDIDDLKSEQARSEHRALHDPLTGLPNRVLLADRLEMAMKQADRDGWRTAVAYLDLDGFKEVNDTLGHAAGDVLLQQVGRRLQASLRPHDTVARLGGDEFVMVLTRLAHEDDGLAILQRLLRDVPGDFVVPGRELRVQASVGVVFHPQPDAGAAELVAMADRAMYRAKHGGGNRIEIHRAG